jgi:hypothetical protein
MAPLTAFLTAFERRHHRGHCRLRPAEVLLEEGDLDGPTRTLSVSRDGISYDVWMAREGDSGVERFSPEDQLEILSEIQCCGHPPCAACASPAR